MKVEKKILGSSGISQQCLQRILDGKKNNKVRLRSGNRHKHGKFEENYWQKSKLEVNRARFMQRKLKKYSS